MERSIESAGWRCQTGFPRGLFRTFIHQRKSSAGQPAGEATTTPMSIGRLVHTTNWIDELTKAFLSGTRED